MQFCTLKLKLTVVAKCFAVDCAFDERMVRPAPFILVKENFEQYHSLSHNMSGPDGAATDDGET